MEQAQRQATVLFADISGFTAISEKLDPEDVTAVMNRCFENLEAIVVAHEGRVVQYLGDCVVAVFGLDDPSGSSRLAVQAGMEIREAIYRYNIEAQLPAKLDVHVGIAGGPVVAGEVGGEVKRQFTVSGFAARLAARLEDVSDQGQIFVSPMTREDTEDEFDYRPVDPVTLREGEAPVPIYELLGIKEKRRRIKRDSERRQATVFFADVYGFRAVSDALGAEAAAELLNRCFTLIESIIRRHGGIVDKYIGQCVMALFGVPNAIEDAPQQAINAAIAIRNGLAEFSADLPAPLDVHMGINTGLVIAGEIGGRVKRDFTVMGDTVNVASRLKDASKMGAIYVGPETYHATRGAFEYRPLEPLRLKGKAEPVSTYELVSAHEHVHRVRREEDERTIWSPLVGRDRELGELRAAIDRLAAGTGGILGVSGEAGLGKSRLMAEAIAGAGDEVTVLEGRSTSMGQNLSFHPFVDLLRRWAGISEDDGESVAFEKLEAALGSAMASEAQEILPFVGTLMGLRLPAPVLEKIEGIDGEGLEKLIFKSVRELLEAVAQQKPLVLIFEDLHWADASSVRLLESVLRLVTESPLLIIGVFRPAYQETAERLVAAAIESYAPWYREVRLAPLDPLQSGQLVENLLNAIDLPYDIRQLVTQKAEGNPFYIEEVVRSLIDQGALECVEGRFRVTKQIESVTIPGTIQEVIMSRVDRLDEPTRHLLQVASVIGRNFYYSIIAELLRMQGKLDAGLNEDLGRLRAKQLLIERRVGGKIPIGDRRLVDEIEYIFSHALAQQTIYESLLQKTRKEFHGYVAETIETLFPERLSDFYGMLAYHYTRADRMEKAEDYLFKAGEVAARSAASSEALNFFREASQMYLRIHGEGGDPLKKMALEKNIGLALLNSGQLTASIEHFDRALEWLGERVPRTAFGRACQFAADLAVVLVRLYLRRLSGPLRDTDREEIKIRYNRARAQTTSDPQRFVFDTIGGLRRLMRTDPWAMDETCSMYTGAAAVFVWSGLSFTIAHRFLTVARDFVRPDNARDEFDYRSWKFVLSFLEGDWGGAHVVPEELIDDVTQQGKFWDVNTYRGLYCERLIHQGAFADAERQIESLTELADGYGYGFARSNQYAMPAFVHLMKGRLPEALAAVQRYYQDRHEPVLRLLALGTQAKIQVLSGDETAGETLTRAEELAARLGREAPAYHRSMLLVARLLFDLRLLERDGASQSRGARRALARRARRSARQALRMSKMVSRERVEVYRLMGRLQSLLERPARAARWWERSILEGERMAAVPELARTYLEIAGCLEQGGNRRTVGGMQVDECRERAQTLFEQSGLDREFEEALLSGCAPAVAAIPAAAQSTEGR